MSLLVTVVCVCESFCNVGLQVLRSLRSFQAQLWLVQFDELLEDHRRYCESDFFDGQIKRASGAALKLVKKEQEQEQEQEQAQQRERTGAEDRGLQTRARHDVRRSLKTLMMAHIVQR